MRRVTAAPQVGTLRFEAVMLKYRFAFKQSWIWGPKSMPEGSKWRSGRRLWVPGWLREKSEVPRGDFWEFFLRFWVTFGSLFGVVFYVFFEGRFFYEKTWFFAKWCFTYTGASLLKVRGRFGGSRDRPKWEKIVPERRKNTLQQKNMKFEEKTKKCEKRISI